MTVQHFNIERSGLEWKNKPIRHVNNLFVFGMSLIGFCLDGYQPSDVFFSIGIVIWLWEPELEVVERRVLSRDFLKRAVLIVTVALLVVAAYASLGVIFWATNQVLAEPLTWIFSIVAFIAVASLFYNAIHWLATNNPVGNIGKEHNEVHRCFMVDHKEHKGV